LFNKNKTELIKYPQGRQGDYIIPDSVKRMENCAFCVCAGLTSVIIPNTVKEIGYEAFMSTGLTAISIPDSIKRIENFTFANCSSLVSVSIPASCTKIGQYAFIHSRAAIFTIHPDNPIFITSPRGKLKRKIKQQEVKQEKISSNSLNSFDF